MGGVRSRLFYNHDVKAGETVKEQIETAMPRRPLGRIRRLSGAAERFMFRAKSR